MGKNSVLLLATILSLAFGIKQAKSQDFISTHSPSQNELNVPIDTEIEVVFNTVMVAETINESTFIVNAKSTGRHKGKIEHTLVYPGPVTAVTFTPDIPFEDGDVVTVLLGGWIKSEASVPMYTSYSWSFTTRVVGGLGTFEGPSSYPADARPIRVIAADLNGDGDIDLVTANHKTSGGGWGSVSVLLNNGCDGVLFEPVRYLAGCIDPRSISAADVNGDGNLDLLVGNYGSPEGEVMVLLNNGDGTFPGSSYGYSVNGAEPLSVFPVDLDGDGHIDVVTANPDGNSITILWNSGDGHFRHRTDYPVRSGPRSVLAADLDGDGDPDLAVVGPYSDYVVVLYNTGNGLFGSRSSYYVDAPIYDDCSGRHPWALVATDLDGDGDLDLATANHCDSTVSILLNDGTGGFTYDSSYQGGSWCLESIIAADLDGDGDIDLAVRGWCGELITVLWNNGSGTSFTPEDFSAGSSIREAVLFSADLDGDGDIDLASLNEDANDPVTVLLNHGNPFFPPGNFRFGNVEMRLGEKGKWFGKRPTLKSKVEVYKNIIGHTNDSGNVTFQIPIRCKDRTLTYDTYFYVRARAYEYEGGPLVAESDLWKWGSSWKKTRKRLFDAFTLHLDPNETKTYWVKVNTYSSRGLPFIANIPLISGYEWWDSSDANVTVVSRAHTDYQQYIKICEPHPNDIYTLGEDMQVRARLSYYDDPYGVHRPCSDTKVWIQLITARGSGSQLHDVNTDSFGDAYLTFNIDPNDPNVNDVNGPLIIRACDVAKNERSNYSPRDEVVVEAVYSNDANTFELFAVPDSGVAQGGSVQYTVGLTSVNYTGNVSLSISGLPPGVTLGQFDPNVVSTALNDTVWSTLTIVTSDNTPLGLHRFTISATDGTKTKKISCPLMVTFNISANEDGEQRDDFSEGSIIYGKAALGLLENKSYPVYVVDAQGEWLDGMSIPSCTHCNSLPLSNFITDGNGDMGAGTVIWPDAQADTLPAYFDIIIDVDSNGLYDAGVDVLDSYPIAGFRISLDTDGDGIADDGDNCIANANSDQNDTDNDGLGNVCDNCPNTLNPDQKDTDGDGKGDVCDDEVVLVFPVNGMQAVGTEVVLSWTPGRHAALHDVYLGTDFDSVNDVNISDLTGVYRDRRGSNSYDACSLDLGKTYFWRIDEVNDVNVWKGAVWQLEVIPHLVVDDFEDYNDITLNNTWTESGSALVSLSVGSGPHHWGNQSMKILYDDAFGAAELGRITSDPNWTASGIKALSAWYKGDPNVDQLHIRLGDGTNTDTQEISDVNVQSAYWQELHLELSQFTGVDMNSISQIAIVITSITDGNGAVYFDDIRLYPTRCVPEYVSADFTGDCTVDYTDIKIMGQGWLNVGYDVSATTPNDPVGWWKLDGSGPDSNVAVDSSTGGHDGLLVDLDVNTCWVGGYDGNALEFPGGGEVYPGPRMSIPDTNGSEFAFGAGASGITWSAWVRTCDPGEREYATIIGKTEPGGNRVPGYMALVRAIGGHIMFIGFDLDERAKSTGRINDGRWHHVAVTVKFRADANDTDLIKLFLDGREDGGYEGQVNWWEEVDQSAFIMMTGGGPRETLAGTIDDVRIYSYPLSHAELISVMGASSLHQPLVPMSSPKDPYEDDRIDFKDYAAMAEYWLEKQLWP